LNRGTSQPTAKKSNARIRNRLEIPIVPPRFPVTLLDKAMMIRNKRNQQPDAIYHILWD
jgi:hypothetical protein